MIKIHKLGCACEKPTSSYTEFRTSALGVDQTHGKNAGVGIQQCKLCQRIWIHYAFHAALTSESGKWYKGIVSKKDRPQITPENALEYLENLEWYVYGGEIFGNTTAFGAGKISLD